MIEDLRLAAKLVLEKCVERGLTACAAESCTGGLVASSIVAEPHASRFFLGSAVVYCDAAKERILKVKNETIERHFAESPECDPERPRNENREKAALAALNLLLSKL